MHGQGSIVGVWSAQSNFVSAFFYHDRLQLLLYGLLACHVDGPDVEEEDADAAGGGDVWVVSGERAGEHTGGGCECAVDQEQQCTCEGDRLPV